MSEDFPSTLDKPFSVEIAKLGRALCKKCKKKCVQGELRIAKLSPNPQASGTMKTWYHVNCIFETFSKQRPSTKRIIEGPKDIEGWEFLNDREKLDIAEKIKDCNKVFEAKFHKSQKSHKRTKHESKHVSHLSSRGDSFSVSSSAETAAKEGLHKDNYFRDFRTVAVNVANVTKSSDKIKIFRDLFTKGRDGTGFKGDVMLWCRLLLPAVMKRVFPLQTKQLIRIFSKLFHISDDIISAQIDPQSDVGQTIQSFFEQSERCKPVKKSTLTLFEVDDFLETLTTYSKEEEQYSHFKSFIKRCTANDLKVIIRLIKHDLRMNAGAKHVLEGLHPDAFAIFQKCRDLKTVVNTCWGTPKKDKSESHSIKVHLKRKHSSSSESKSKKIKSHHVETITIKDSKSDEKQRRNSVPNYFENCVLYLEDGVRERHREWVHNFIAFGGTVPLDLHEKIGLDEKATRVYVLHLRDTIAEPTFQCVSSARHVIVEWIKDSVEKKSLQDFRPYTVRWDPQLKGK